MPKAAKVKNARATASRSKKASKPTVTTEKDTEDIPMPIAESYLLQVRLNRSNDPTITRLLVVPSNFTFEKLHEVLQVAFGWADCHAHSFDILQLHEEGKPRARRQWESVLTLKEDNLDASSFPHPERIQKEADFTLANIFVDTKYDGKIQVVYEYDHGDGWVHGIVFLGRADPSLRSVMNVPDDLEACCLGGEGHPAAEDCGGSSGWEYLKSVFKKGKKDPEGLKEWYKTTCTNGDPKGLDPYRWDMLDVNDGLTSVKA
ncbi:hypothetical protein BT63DRAFT_481285 [Microthyrium microscopicum]|uniref:Plasmid pRiA4b Orf3-like domain-containing protein n=1 Tax=Microthyrium microscopicum TaxID=703497 RepID=A0A6A6U696_9PEZI|nr:hypothetical protein BT63DRAFT_481285 [Microthyrium microscopicum]